jgi:uncharacterized membrane protein YhaH (DUF805 family)
MSFAEAVRSVLSQYATFSGRARRSEFWWFALFYFLVLFVASILDRIVGSGYGVANIGIFYTLAVLALLLPNIAVTIRRLHDTGRSGWWWLIWLVPLVGWIILIVFCVQDSQPGPNHYGESPKGAGQQYGAPGTGWAQPQQ